MGTALGMNGQPAIQPGQSISIRNKGEQQEARKREEGCKIGDRWPNFLLEFAHREYLHTGSVLYKKHQMVRSNLFLMLTCGFILEEI